MLNSSLRRFHHPECPPRPCYGRGGNDLPRLILIFVAAEKSGFACYGRGGSDLPRLILIFVAAEKNGFACRTGLLLLRFLISGGEFGNHCKKSLRNGPGAAVILDFKG